MSLATQLRVPAASADRPRPEGSDETGFTLIELVIAMTMLAMTFLAFAAATGGGLAALQAGRQRSAFVELANAELERLRSIPFESLGVSKDDPDLASAYDPGPKHGGLDAVQLDVPALKAANPNFADPPPAVETITTPPISGVRPNYVIHRWITWSTAGGVPGTTELKQIDLELDWTEASGANRHVALQSLRYPGDQGPAPALDHPPIAVARASSLSVTLGTSITFDGTGSSDPDETLAPTAYSWQFGDGTTAVGPTATHTYLAASVSYTAVLTVTDSAGLSTNAPLNISVSAPNQPPHPSFYTESSVGTVPFDVIVHSTSTDPEGGAMTYSWDWGDGTTPPGTGQDTHHVYATPGTFTITLTVTDDGNNPASAQLQITANPLNCQVTSGSFKNPGTNATKNDIDVANNGKPSNKQFVFTATSNLGCTSMTASIPRSGGTYTVNLTYTDSGNVRTWTATDSVSSSVAFVKATNQTGSFAGSGGASLGITFNVHT